MSTKYPGGLITKTPVTPAGPYETGAAPGVWTVEQALQYTKQGIWPIAGNTPNYIENVFSTYLYAGNGATQTITNGIDLSGQGGLVWSKIRTQPYSHSLVDTVRGVNKTIESDLTNAQQTKTDLLTAFNSNGYTLGADASWWVNKVNETYASWTFRKQQKFFDVVTWTGNSTAGRQIAHNLGSVPGFIAVKATNNGSDWFCYHRSLGGTKRILLNSTGAAATDSNAWNNTDPTSTVFTVGAGADVNYTGITYVAYIYAHNAGGFGLTGTDNVISCGSITGNNSLASYSLGYEPQWLLIKPASTIGNWTLYNTMEGWTADGNGSKLYPNLSDAETPFSGQSGPTSTGFTYYGTTGVTYIYIAIRKGPMKVPTSGTSVYATDTLGGTSPNPPGFHSGFPVDFGFYRDTTSAFDWNAQDRLRGNFRLFFNSTAAESSSAFGGDYQNGYNSSTSVLPAYRAWMFRRAPSFFDEVCFTATGSGMTLNHNLGVSPELVISKQRSSTSQWSVNYSFGATTCGEAYLNLTNAGGIYAYTAGTFVSAQPTSTQLSVAAFTSGQTYVAYLFATCAGVSKVGSYTGTGTTLQINCGFTGGARFVLIKRTDSTGDWYVWDTARGMTSGTDPSLLLNSTAAEVNANSIYTTTGGFQIVSTAAGINASGGTYIYLAIA